MLLWPELLSYTNSRKNFYWFLQAGQNPPHIVNIYINTIQEMCAIWKKTPHGTCGRALVRTSSYWGLHHFTMEISITHLGVQELQVHQVDLEGRYHLENHGHLWRQVGQAGPVYCAGLSSRVSLQNTRDCSREVSNEQYWSTCSVILKTENCADEHHWYRPTTTFVC